MDALPGFLRIPLEIRIQIYALLFINEDESLRFRMERSGRYHALQDTMYQRRSAFRVIEDRLRSRSVETTYKYFAMGLYRTPLIETALLHVNRQIHDESGHVLYSGYTLDFGMDIECIRPLLQDLTPAALSSIKSLRVVQRPLPYVKDFDRCEWKNAFDFISQHMSLTRLDLCVCGGTPKRAFPSSQWKKPEPYEKSDQLFLALFQRTNPDSEFCHSFRLMENHEEMEWAKQVSAVKGLRTLNVKEVMEHCPIPTSEAMQFFIKFSASIETGFAEYMKDLMIKGS